uniref:DUF4283 domain-containing protein n=1 Tax=Cajanus cajan TaxID=3821 RepID=A0A151T4P2_CAJCA|nr:hypothetical protein KK1_016528 [Cajanus cajan]
MDVDHEYFLASFDLDDDREKAINGGPWMIFDHYLTVRPWSPNFSAQDDSINKTLVWVRFLNLNMMFYVESVLLTIASVIGKPLKVDLHTANMLRERFARVCVEVDLNTPVVGKFNLNGKWYNIEYEGLHLLCSNCGCYGHVNWNCSLKTTEEQGPTPAGEATALGNDSVSRNNAKSISCNISATNQDKSVISAHGDWLVVRRKKKSNIQKSSKDFVQNNSNSNKGFTFQSSAGRSTANNPKATPMHATPKSTSSRGIKQTSSRGFIKKIDPTTLMGSTLSVTIRKGLSSFVCTAIYASPVPRNREALWSYLREIRIRISTPWLLIGDFNEVLSPNEVRGGSFSLRQRDLQQQYDDVLVQEEFFWFQKSHEKWVKFGDRNTKFFHAQTMIHRNRNKIHGLFLEDGSWSTDPTILQRETQRFYMSLFSADVQQQPSSLLLDQFPQLDSLAIPTL